MDGEHQNLALLSLLMPHVCVSGRITHDTEGAQNTVEAQKAHMSKKPEKSPDKSVRGVEQNMDNLDSIQESNECPAPRLEDMLVMIKRREEIVH